MVNLNGSAAQDLLDQYAEASRAVEAALEAIPMPHGRDYLPHGNSIVYEQARAQAQTWVRTLATLRDQLAQVHAQVYQQRR